MLNIRIRGVKTHTIHISEYFYLVFDLQNKSLTNITGLAIYRYHKVMRKASLIPVSHIIILFPLFTDIFAMMWHSNWVQIHLQDTNQVLMWVMKWWFLYKNAFLHYSVVFVLLIWFIFIRFWTMPHCYCFGQGICKHECWFEWYSTSLN